VASERLLGSNRKFGEGVEYAWACIRRLQTQVYCAYGYRVIIGEHRGAGGVLSVFIALISGNGRSLESRDLDPIPLFLFVLCLLRDNLFLIFRCWPFLNEVSAIIQLLLRLLLVGNEKQDKIMQVEF
jgi:hypothetical protein